jgi:hypothetical protein
MGSSVPEFTDRPSLKLYAAKQHLDRLRELHNNKGSIVASEARLQAEIEIDEFFYQLVSAKDALLQEINRKLGLRLLPEEVNCEKINAELKRISRHDLMKAINQITNEKSWLWEVNQFHNISEHRELIGKEIVVVTTKVTKVSLHHPKTHKAVGDVFDYLPDSLKKMERLVADVRSKIY